MLTAKIKQLEATKAKIARLEKSIASQMNRKLAGLPGEYGFESVEAFLQAVRSASGGRRRGRGPGRKRRAGRRGGPGKARRRRAVITDATRSQVKSMVGAGKTGSAIAKALKISVPTVHNIKKALGLVKARKSK